MSKNTQIEDLNPLVTGDNLEIFYMFLGKIVLVRRCNGSFFSGRLIDLKGSFLLFEGRDGRASILRISDVADLFELSGRGEAVT